MSADVSRGLWRRYLEAFYREREGQPFSLRDVLDRFPRELRRKETTYQMLRRQVRAGELVVMRERHGHEPRLYAPVLRGRA